VGTLLGLALVDFGCDPRSSDSLRGRQNFVCFFGKINNARFHRFPVGQISWNLKTTTSIGVTMKTFGTVLWKFTVMGRFSNKRKNFSLYFNVLRLQAAITTQWLQIAQNSLPSDPSTGCLVSIFVVRINSKSFLWSVRSVQETYSNFRQRPIPILGKRSRLCRCAA